MQVLEWLKAHTYMWGGGQTYVYGMEQGGEDVAIA